MFSAVVVGRGEQLFRLHTLCTNYLAANIYPRHPRVKRKTCNKSKRRSGRDGKGDKNRKKQAKNGMAAKKKESRLI